MKWSLRAYTIVKFLHILVESGKQASTTTDPITEDDIDAIAKLEGRIMLIRRGAAAISR